MKGSTLLGLAFLALSVPTSVGWGAVLKNETFNGLPDNLTASSWNGWSVYVDPTATMGGASDIGGRTGRSLKMTDAVTGATGSVWKPQLEYSSTVTTGFTVSFDWYISSPATLTDAQALQLYISKKGAPTGSLPGIQIGGSSGVNAGTNRTVAFTPVYDQWNSIVIACDAPSSGSSGTMTITVTQGNNAPVSNSFTLSSTALPSINSFAFQLGGSVRSGDNVAVYLDNIVIETVPEAASLGFLGLGFCALLRRRI